MEIKENQVLEGCGFCRDKRTQRTITLYFIDRANNMRPCYYCPNCGRKFKEDNNYDE